MGTTKIILHNLAKSSSGRQPVRSVVIMMTSSNGNIFHVTGHCAGIHRSPVNSLHKGQWRGALEFSLICAWMDGWVSNREAGDLSWDYYSSLRFETPSCSLWRHCNASFVIPLWAKWKLACYEIIRTVTHFDLNWVEFSCLKKIQHILIVRLSLVIHDNLKSADVSTFSAVLHIFQTTDRTSCPEEEKSMGHGSSLSVLKWQKW